MKKTTIIFVSFLFFTCNLIAKQLSGYISCSNDYIVQQAYIPGIDETKVKIINEPCNKIVDLALLQGKIVGITWASNKYNQTGLIYAIVIEAKNVATHFQNNKENKLLS